MILTFKLKAYISPINGISSLDNAIVLYQCNMFLWISITPNTSYRFINFNFFWNHIIVLKDYVFFITIFNIRCCITSTNKYEVIHVEIKQRGLADKTTFKINQFMIFTIVQKQLLVFKISLLRQKQMLGKKN